MKGNLIWSMRTQTAKFVEDENGKFEIVDGQIEPLIKVRVVDNSDEINRLIRMQKRITQQVEEANINARNAASYSYRNRGSVIDNPFGY